MTGADTKFEDRVVISGIGQSAIGRRLGRSPLALTLDAITAALDDAGLAPRRRRRDRHVPRWRHRLGAGFAGPPLAEVYDAFGLDVDFMLGNFEGPAQLGPVLTGSLAIDAGLVRHVVVYRTVTEGTRTATRERGARAGRARRLVEAVDHAVRWRPGTARVRAARAPPLPRVRHDARAARPDRAHRASPRAAEPEGRLPRSDDDGRLPVGAHDRRPAVPVRLRRALRRFHRVRPVARRLRVRRARRRSSASKRWAWHRRRGRSTRSTSTSSRDCARPRRCGAAPTSRPADVDVAGLYDGFSILTMLWLEALGFCGLGESGPFVEGGERITLGGELPINPNGGQLSGGRLHGLGFVHEMCLQLRGGAGARQVAVGPGRRGGGGRGPVRRLHAAAGGRRMTDAADPRAPLRAPHTVAFSYERSVGGATEQFLRGLARAEVWGSRMPDGRVVVPPVDHDPATGAPSEAFVRVGDAGVVRTWTWVADPTTDHPLTGRSRSRSSSSTAPTRRCSTWSTSATRREWRRASGCAPTGATDESAASATSARSSPTGRGGRSRLGRARSPTTSPSSSDVRLHYTFEPGLVLSSFYRALGERRIEGGRCASCGKVFVPPHDHCPACGTGPMPPVRPRRRGHGGVVRGRPPSRARGWTSSCRSGGRGSASTAPTFPSPTCSARSRPPTSASANAWRRCGTREPPSSWEAIALLPPA